MTRSERYKIIKALSERAKVSDSPWDIIQYSGDGMTWVTCDAMPKMTNNVLYRIDPMVEL
jgi:hypothetical protein